MDWVHAEAAPRFPGEVVAPLRPAESPPGSASSVVQQQRALPELDASWATQGGSSQGLGWQAPSPNLAGWQAGAGSPREADGGSSNAPPDGVGLGLAGKVDVASAQQVQPSPLAGGRLAGSLTVPTPALGHPRGEVAPRLPSPPSYSSVAVFGAADGGVGSIGVTREQSAAASTTATSAGAGAASAGAATTATTDGVVVGEGVVGGDTLQQEQQGQQELVGEVAGIPFPAHPTGSLLPASTPAVTTAAAAAAAAAGRPTPKKKPRGPRAPKKKAKPPAAPMRRAVKVKKPRPPEVPLGENGRERAMDLLRLLVGSPLSEEFHRPVVQMHPEVGAWVWVGWRWVLE